MVLVKGCWGDGEEEVLGETLACPFVFELCELLLILFTHFALTIINLMYIS